MITVNEILITETDEIVAAIAYPAFSEESATEKVSAIHSRNQKMGMQDGVNYRVELVAS